ncbi:hypothetical protein [Flammeovirga sp. SJP92]|uniref:hypothetical protein n=1 Tax=Flammeovirga sp. SJP92 TaxID=1775430 RepID=UPI0007878BDA|nr:hypothetical protein [Flammeovirga sp. SJP92]KXX67687.1 hypothetical protein AVL50_24765 [Flammeovirga sp. SJP92]
MKSKKTLEQLAKELSKLEENQLGKLKGGFVAFSSLKAKELPSTDSVSVSVSGNCSCSCTCS